jgi:hypothetical protein
VTLSAQTQGWESIWADLVGNDLRPVRVEYAEEGDVIQVGAHYHVQALRP